MRIELNITLYMRYLLLYRMAGTLVQALQNQGMAVEPIAIHKVSTENFFDRVQELYKSVCAQSLKKDCEQRRVENSIIAFINNNFHNKEMGLKMLSAEIGMTESYLSTLIKKLVGEPFSSYLERLRIQSANELLSDERIAISEIGARVGYDNTSTFGRAYKRCMGFSPSQYRKNLVTKASDGVGERES